MDYEKKYKAAFNWIASLYDGLHGKTKEEAERLFPELKESEDEKIRKAILTGLIDCRDAPDLGWSNFGGINIDECIVWLEKQGERKVMAPEEKEILLKGLKWSNMETLESHCYNCKLFDSKNNVCKCIELCKNPKSTFKGFYVK